MRTPFRQYLFRVSAILVSCTLICAFAVHSVETEHHHPGQTHSHHHEGGSFFSLGEYAHAAEKKSFLILSGAFALLFSLYAGVQHGARFLLTPALIRSLSARPKRIGYYSAIEQCFANGILHPKLCG